MADETMRWPGDAKVAVSLSYDDALDSQLDNAVPALNKHKIRASFYLTLSHSSVHERLADWRAVAAAGHELGNHTVYHGCRASLPDRDWVAPHLDLDNRSVDELSSEVAVANTVLHAIDGRNKRTFTVPCGDELAGGENYVDVVAPMFVAIKGRDEGMPDDSRYFIAPFDVTGEELISQVREHTRDGVLLNILFHGVGGDHLAVSTEAHDELLQFLANNSNDYWVDTYINIMTHVGEQEKAQNQ